MNKIGLQPKDPILSFPVLVQVAVDTASALEGHIIGARMLLGMGGTGQREEWQADCNTDVGCNRLNKVFGHTRSPAEGFVGFLDPNRYWGRQR